MQNRPTAANDPPSRRRPCRSRSASNPALADGPRDVGIGWIPTHARPVVCLLRLFPPHAAEARNRTDAPNQMILSMRLRIAAGVPARGGAPLGEIQRRAALRCARCATRAPGKAARILRPGRRRRCCQLSHQRRRVEPLASFDGGGAPTPRPGGGHSRAAARPAAGSDARSRECVRAPSASKPQRAFGFSREREVAVPATRR